MNKTASIIIAVGLVVAFGIVFFGQTRNNSELAPAQSAQNVEVRDGVQYVTITAKGGYSPRISTIQGGIPTKLIVRTNGTYDCSASLVVRSSGFRKVLQPTGEEIIDLGTPKPGEKIQGVCGMGMYNFQIRTI